MKHMDASIKPSMFAHHRPTHAFASAFGGDIPTGSARPVSSPVDRIACMTARKRYEHALKSAGLWVYDADMPTCVLPDGVHDRKGLASFLWDDADAIGGSRMERMIRGHYGRIWHDGLSDAMRHALIWYCDVGYAAMNAGLDGRAALSSEDMQACMLARDACMLAGGLREDAIMYRTIMTNNMPSNARNAEETMLYRAFADAEPVIRRSFTSVSMRDGMFGDGFDRTHIILRVHRGVHGFAVPSNVRDVGIDEHEFIIAPDAVMKVIGVFETSPLEDGGMGWKDDHPVIAAEVFPQERQASRLAWHSGV